jgi:hypothetical protein
MGSIEASLLDQKHISPVSPPNRKQSQSALKVPLSEICLCRRLSRPLGNYRKVGAFIVDGCTRLVSLSVFRRALNTK